MASDNLLVTVVVLSYNRPDFLRESLRALVAQTYPHLRVVVVDNRSPASEHIAKVVADFPGVELVRNAENLGFTGGMNVGIRAATGKYVLLLEDDVVADAGCAAALVDYAEAHPEVGLCGGVMLNRGSGTVRCAGGELSLGARFGKRVIGSGLDGAHPFGEPYPVTYLPGALMFARREDLLRLGGFREDFFMYFEDDELCLRVRKAGWQIAVVPGARVAHFEPPAGPCPGWLEFVKTRNLLRLYLLHAPLLVLPYFLCRNVAYEFVRLAVRCHPRCLVLLRAALDTLLRSPGLLRDRSRTQARVASSG